ncbi:MAG: cellulose biosynthesis cyclic di-GMP-binding regulatory protein BcsB [Nocardiaceae bacterium]|nr:cellulose biosynthesis cyclic di-GMP-binding regulatory protein BcsB [Nocardiaceae bacterium]
MARTGAHSRAPRRRLATLATGTLVAIAALLPGVGTASAQDSDDTTVVTGQSVPFPELGRPADLQFTSDSTPVTVTVPVPDGLQVRHLTGTLTTPMDFRQGWLEVRSDGRVVERVEIPAANEEGIPLSVPLDGLRVTDRSVTFTISSHYIPVDDRCYDRSQFAPLTLRDVAVAYDGTERQPASPAEFLPPILRKLTIYVADASSAAEQNAALALSTAVVNHYGNQPTRVEVAEIPAGGGVPSVAPALFERSIAVGGSTDAGIGLEATPAGAPVLRITGNETALSSQVDLFVANLDGYAAASRAIAAPDAKVPEVAQDVVSLEQLKIGSLTASGLNHIEVPIEVNQTQLGRPIRDLSAHMFGTYVPLPPSRSGILTVSLGGTQLASAPLDASGTFDVHADVPNNLLSRFMTLTVALDITGDFQCGTSDASSLTVDPRSTVSSHLASPPLPGGFASLPQTLLPTVDVGLGDNGLGDLRRANQLLVQMQHSSYLPLQPRVRPLTEAATDTLPAILVAADGNLPQSVRQPLASADPALLALQGVSGTTPYGTLQVIEQGNRSIVIATSNGEARDLDALLGWLDADPSQFPRLTGDVLIGPRDAQPFAIGVKVTDIAAQADADEDSGIGTGAIVAIVAGTAVLAVIVVGATVWLRRRRS